MSEPFQPTAQQLLLITDALKNSQRMLSPAFELIEKHYGERHEEFAEDPLWRQLIHLWSDLHNAEVELRRQAKGGAK